MNIDGYRITKTILPIRQILSHTCAAGLTISTFLGWRSWLWWWLSSSRSFCVSKICATRCPCLPCSMGFVVTEGEDCCCKINPLLTAELGHTFITTWGHVNFDQISILWNLLLQEKLLHYCPIWRKTCKIHPIDDHTYHNTPIAFALLLTLAVLYIRNNEIFSVIMTEWAWLGTVTPLMLHIWKDPT